MNYWKNIILAFIDRDLFYKSVMEAVDDYWEFCNNFVDVDEINSHYNDKLANEITAFNDKKNSILNNTFNNPDQKE